MSQINLTDTEISWSDLLEIPITVNIIEDVKQTLRITC
jgi:hypothetical protein